MGHPLTVPDVARQIIAAGIPLILEKPAASATGNLMRVVEAVRERGGFVGVPLPNRFGPVFRTMAELEAEGRLGKL